MAAPERRLGWSLDFAQYYRRDAKSPMQPRFDTADWAGSEAVDQDSLRTPRTLWSLSQLFIT
jgi:hypothetical protein